MKLKDFATINMGQSPKGETYNTDGNGMPFLQGRKTFGRIYPTIDTWTTNPIKVANKDEILMSVRAPVGDMNFANQEICIGRGLCSINAKNGRNKYLYYMLLNSMNDLKQKSTGTVFDSINRNDLENLEIDFHSDGEQIKIEKILSSIDSKIELNNEINNNLYELLRTNFNDIFTDDNSNQIRLEEIVSIRRGSSPRPIQDYLSEKGINWLKISDVTGIDSPYIYNIREKIKEEGKSKSVFLTKGALVVSNSATPGIPKYIMVDTCVHDGWLILNEYDEKYKYYLYFLIEKIREKLISLSNGSVFNNLKTDILKSFVISKPTDEQLNLFNHLAFSIMPSINSNTKENIKLEQLRDTLLPKLMNGEIDLNNIDIRGDIFE